MRAVKKYDKGGIKEEKKKSREEKKEEKNKDKVRRQIKRLQKKLEKLTPNSNNKPSVAKTAVSFNMNDSNDGVKGSCEEGNLKACKSEVIKKPSFNPNKSRFNLNKVGDPQKRKEIQAEIDELTKKLRGSASRHANPRFL